MKRLLRFSLNLALVILSIKAGVLMVRGVDAVVGWFLPEREWPGPGIGLVFRPGTEDNYDMLDYTCVDHINSLGFRDREFGVRKTAKIRAVAIGDSFTYGWGVNIEDTWCKRLEANLRNQGIDIEILNLGKPGAGPRDYARLADIAIPRLKPDLVILSVLQTDDLSQMGDAFSLDPENYVKDYFPHLVSLELYLRWRGVPLDRPGIRTFADSKKWYADTARDFAARMSDEDRARFDKLEPAVKEAFTDGRLNPWVIGQVISRPDLWVSTLTPGPYDSRLQIRLAARKFKQIDRTARRNGARLIVLSMPGGFHVNEESLADWRRLGFAMNPNMLESTEPDRAIAEACRQAGITSLHSVTSEFRKHRKDTGLYYKLDQHMTPAGHALFAELITPIMAAEVGNATPHPAPPKAAGQ